MAQYGGMRVGDRVEVKWDRGSGEVVANEVGQGMALLFTVRLDSGKVLSVADSNMRVTGRA
jgi:hypothetical protein